MKTKITVACVAIFLVVSVLSVFTVTEGESALLLRLGNIVSDRGVTRVFSPGMHYKIPFLDTVRIFDMRVQELATPAAQPLTVVTKEQTYLLVEYFAKWRIEDLPRFYKSTGGSVIRAETLLEQRLNDIVRAEYGKRSSNQAISVDRAQMMQAIKELASTVGQDQGLRVIDVRIQQITLPKDVLDSVFTRMAAERKQFAEAKRAEGWQKAEVIKAFADQRVTIIKAEALKQGAEIRARGDLAAANIFAKAYNSDPVFYAFYRSLEAYLNSFNHKNDILVVKPDGQFFNYFHQAGNGDTQKKASV